MKTLFASRPADSLTILFLLFLLSLSLAFYQKIPLVTNLLLVYAVLFFVQIFFVRYRESIAQNRILDVAVNVGFPVLCVLVIFDSLEGLVHSINPKDIDPLLIRLDYLVFKGYPTVMLEAVHAPLLTDILQIAYSSYYFLPVALGLLLKIGKRDKEFDRTVFLILLCFYLSYIGYLLFPALGPRYTMNHLQSVELEGLFVAGSIQEFLNRLEGVKRDAFPSGHTAIVLVVSGLAYRFHKGFFFVTFPVILLLIFSTVYCRYHYVADVIGGMVLAAITFFIGEKYYGRWEIGNSTDR